VNLNDIFATNDSTDAIDNKLDAQRAIEKLGHIDRAILYLWVSGMSTDDIGKITGYSTRTIVRRLNKLCQK
jgi:DNA-binding CsgD family transcriptional regulator